MTNKKAVLIIAAISIVLLGVTLSGFMESQAFSAWFSSLFFAAVIGIVVFVYLWLCQLVAKAAERKGRNRTSWFWIAFFFGLIIPAVIVAVMAPSANDFSKYELRMRCPYCGEEILQIAQKCKHCGSNIPDDYDPDDPSTESVL